MRLASIIIMTFLITGCSGLQKDLQAFFPKLDLSDDGPSSHPLKTKKDLEIEKHLTKGAWNYQRQDDDCKDTHWAQKFYKNRYYKSGGSACLLADAFSVEAENWHIKNGVLYITNLSPIGGNDIILKYGINYLDDKKLILSSGKYKYTFVK